MKIEPLLTNAWYLRQGATPDEIQRAEASLGVSLPDDYRALIAWSNGGDLLIGERYFRLWPLQEAIDSNEFLEVPSYQPGAIAIGSDASDTLYLLDYRNNRALPALSEVEAGSLGVGPLIRHGDSLEAAFRSWSGIDTARARLLRVLRTRVPTERKTG